MSPEERSKTTPRTVMIGGKAFATYTNAKRIVKLVNDVGAVVNTDPEVNNYLKVMSSWISSAFLCDHIISTRRLLCFLFFYTFINMFYLLLNENVRN